jgi:hypothetical protein
MKLVLLCLTTSLLIQGCDSFKSTEDKQLKACIADVKLGLGDPESLELIDFEGIQLDNGWFRLNVNFTAKNALGGRVRGNTLCGFATKSDLDLNKDDFVNQERRVARLLNSINNR